MKNNVAQKIMAVCLIFIMAFIAVSCNNSGNNQNQGWTNPSLSDPNGDKLTEDTDIEDKLNEFITAEIYLKEIIVVEEKLQELLLQEEKIEEVILCTTIYVPQENIKEFSEHSQSAQLFGEGIDLAPLLTKVAIGTGVIITLTVLSVSGLQGPVGSIVAAAAPAALKGAALGTLFGGLTGAATGAITGTADEIDKIDETKRASAIAGFALATIGVISATISAITAIPSGGSTAAGVVFGIKIAIAGVSLASAAYAGYNMVKTLKTTDAHNIDWKNIDWNRVGVSAAEQAINGAADGYVWGSVIGAISGGLEGYKQYETHGTPYSSYDDRIKRTPADGERGHWTGKRGESTFVLDEPITCKNGTVVKEITYRNGTPDFSDYSVRQVTISNMTDNRYRAGGNFEQADTALAKYWSKTKFQGKSWTVRDIKQYRTQNGLTWHEMNNMKTMQLVSTEVNATWGHLGGCSEYRTMIGQSGGQEFD